MKRITVVFTLALLLLCAFGANCQVKILGDARKDVGVVQYQKSVVVEWNVQNTGSTSVSLLQPGQLPKPGT